MGDITNNEMVFVLTILKNPEKEFNANNMAKHIGISSMGALKIAKRLEKENILVSRELGKARFYKLNLDNEYAMQYARFLLKREAEYVSPYVKRWVNELRKIKSADAAVLFGSIIKKGKAAKDVDVLLITNEKRFGALKKEIMAINLLNVKKIHPVYQTKSDFKQNLKKQDKVVLNTLKGIIVYGEDILLELLK